MIKCFFPARVVKSRMKRNEKGIHNKSTHKLKDRHYLHGLLFHYAAKIEDPHAHTHVRPKKDNFNFPSLKRSSVCGNTLTQ